MDKISILSWNIRGASNLVNRRNIRAVVQECKAPVLCVQETKCPHWNEKMIITLGMGSDVGWLDSPSLGLSGGLLLAWDKSIVKVTDLGNFTNWQWILGSSIGSNADFLLLNVYAPQKLIPKQELWNQISTFLSSRRAIPTAIIGDCNAVLSVSEREHCTYNHRDMMILREFLQENSLIDIPLSNVKFTWYGPDNRKSRLDRAMLSINWNETGSWALRAYNRKNSDHRPILLSSRKFNWGPRPFKFFNHWLKNEELVHQLGEVWKAHPNASLNHRFKEIRLQAKRWNLTTNGNVDAKIAKLELDQEKADSEDAPRDIKQKIKEDLDKAYEEKSSMLCQISRMNWQLTGNETLNFFTE